ncbi:MAG: ATP-binding protein [Rhodobacteraceae bacterium]|nr:ATP-binding protein [Paracoccaceae bacterium]
MLFDDSVAGRDAPAAFVWCFAAEPFAVRDALCRTMARFSGIVSTDAADALELALAEVLNNVVEHGYAGVPAGAVHLSITSGAGVLTCRIVDQGRPMPGLRLPEGKIGPPDCRVHELPEGGWGWALIRLLTLNLQYERLDGCNRVTFQVPVQSEARDR